MTLINAFKNPDASPSPRTTHVATDVHITIGGRPVSASQSRRDEMAMRINAAVEAHRIASRTETVPGGWSGWVTSEGRAASDFPRVELTPHHPEQALLDRTEREDRSDLTRYRLTALQGQLTALQRPLNAIANEAGAIARDGVGSWTPEQVETLVRVSDLEAEVETLLTALRERF